MWTRCLGGFSVMWVTKLLIFPVEIRIFCPKTTKFGPKLAFLINLGQAMQAYSMSCCELVGGCGARAVSRKTPIYFIEFDWSKSHFLQFSTWNILEGSIGINVVETVLTKLGRPTDTATMESLLRRWTRKSLCLVVVTWDQTFELSRLIVCRQVWQKWLRKDCLGEW